MCELYIFARDGVCIYYNSKAANEKRRRFFEVIDTFLPTIRPGSRRERPCVNGGYDYPPCLISTSF